jgi:hypothetical protein
MATIKCVKARQIFDSRGNPTVEVICFLYVLTDLYFSDRIEISVSIWQFPDCYLNE